MSIILNRKEISDLLPHKGVMLLPQKFEVVMAGNAVFADGEMLIRKNNFFLKRHFGVYPGVMLIEFLNQLAALSIKATREIIGNPIVCRLDDPGPDYGKIKTVAGDTVRGHVVLMKSKRGMFFFKADAYNQKKERLMTTGIVGAASEKPKNELVIPAEEENIKI